MAVAVVVGVVTDNNELLLNKKLKFVYVVH